MDLTDKLSLTVFFFEELNSNSGSLSVQISVDFNAIYNAGYNWILRCYGGNGDCAFVASFKDRNTRDVSEDDRTSRCFKRFLTSKDAAWDPYSRIRGDTLI